MIEARQRRAWRGRTAWYGIAAAAATVGGAVVAAAPATAACSASTPCVAEMQTTASTKGATDWIGYLTVDSPFSLPSYTAGERLNLRMRSEWNDGSFVETGVAVGGPLGGSVTPNWTSTPKYYKRTKIGTSGTPAEVSYSDGPGTSAGLVRHQYNESSSCWTPTVGSHVGSCIALGMGGGAWWWVHEASAGLEVAAASGYKGKAHGQFTKFLDGGFTNWEVSSARSVSTVPAGCATLPSSSGGWDLMNFGAGSGVTC